MNSYEEFKELHGMQQADIVLGPIEPITNSVVLSECLHIATLVLLVIALGLWLLKKRELAKDLLFFSAATALAYISFNW